MNTAGKLPLLWSAVNLILLRTPWLLPAPNLQGGGGGRAGKAKFELETLSPFPRLLAPQFIPKPSGSRYALRQEEGSFLPKWPQRVPIAFSVGHLHRVGRGFEDNLSPVRFVFFFPLFCFLLPLLGITDGPLWLAAMMPGPQLLQSFKLPCRTGSLAFCCSKIFKQEKLGC